MDAAEVEAEMQEIANRVNTRIEEEGADWHPAEYLARAEMVAEEEVPQSWEWTLAESMGMLPVVVLLRRDPRRHVGKSAAHVGKVAARD